MPVELPDYSFLPWSRRGIAVHLDQVDNLGTTPDAGPKDRATLTASITLESVPVPGAPAVAPAAVSKTASLVGPGDVKSFKPETVLRAMPVAGSASATPGELGYVEFYDEDFPWRYTPAVATADHKLRPWIALLVLADGEYTLTPVPGDVAILTVHESVPLPPVTETWAWAHVQAHGDLSAGDPGVRLDQQVNATPDLARSRLLSPRRLDLDTSYHAFVVPAFETGRLAGLRTPAAPDVVPAQQPSWGGQSQPGVFPVLYDWTFRTSAEQTDFEVLARRPKAYRIEAERFGTRDLDISDPGAGVHLPAGTTVALEGALAPIELTRIAFPDSPGVPLSNQLLEVVDQTVDHRDSGTADPDEDPIVTPPAYARQHAGLERVADATEAGTRWLAELNLDPRNRAAAGLGAEIVRQRDESYIERAWAQVEQLDAVNQRLREAELAMTASDRIFAKHVANSGPDRMLGLAAGVQSALRADVGGDRTIRGEVDASRVPAAAQAPAFRRITRPARPLIRHLIKTTTSETTTSGLQSELFTRLNEEPDAAVSTAPPVPDPALGIPPSVVLSAAQAMAAQLPRGRDVFPVLAGEVVEDRRQAGTLGTVTLGAVQSGVRSSLDALYPASTADHATLRAEALALNDVLTANDANGQPVSTLTAGDAGGDHATVMRIPTATFSEYYGDSIDGKNYLGLVIAPTTTAPLVTLGTTAGLSNAADFATAALTDYSILANSRPLPTPAAALTAPTTLAEDVKAELRPLVAMPKRLATLLVGIQDVTATVANGRRLKPVLAYPTFDDPLFEPLRQLSQDYIVPNIADLPSESIALMVPNVRFIESLAAGANTELARELLWNEYPTDQRGTYLARFFDATDAGDHRPPDVPELHGWTHDLGANCPQLSGLLVLVVRAALLVKFPDTIVFAQHGIFTGTGTARRRTLDPAGEVRYPVVRGRLDPDISLYGFEMTVAEASGTASDAGFFFCFMERPGQLRFGLDLDEDPGAPAPELASWNDLNWKHLKSVAGQATTQVLIDANTDLTPTTVGLPDWGTTSAHMASILCQNPVWLARHATDMLPVD